ncbi:MAG: hypothetical protein ABI359_02985 [Ginsengibacter sp.]
MYFRPLSKSTIQKLKECYQKDHGNSDDNYCMMDDMSHALAPLYKRALIEVKRSVVYNKTLYCIFLTKTGEDFVRNLNA